MIALLATLWLLSAVPPVGAAPPLHVELDRALYYGGIQAAAAAFTRKSGIEVALSKGSCGTSFDALTHGRAAVGGFCCPDGAGDRKAGLRFFTVGIVPLAIITHHEGTCENLTRTEVESIFRGQIRRWEEIADPKRGHGPIVPVARLHCPVRGVGWKRILPREDLFTRLRLEAASIAEMVSIVMETRGAVGWETPQIESILPFGDNVRMVRLDGVDPHDMQAVRAGRYPYYRVLNLALPTPATDEATAFVRFVRENAARFVDRRYIVPLSELGDFPYPLDGVTFQQEADRAALQYP